MKIVNNDLKTIFKANSVLGFVLGLCLVLFAYQGKAQGVSTSKTQNQTTPATGTNSGNIDKSDLGIHDNMRDVEPDHMTNMHLTVMHIHSVSANKTKVIKTKLHAKSKSQKVNKAKKRKKVAKKHKIQRPSVIHHHL